MSRAQALENVLRNPAIWRAEPAAHGLHQTLATTHAELDKALPERGWPLGALTEFMLKANGIGELALLVPALRAVCMEGRGIALLAPPHLPQARAWEQAGIPPERLLLVKAEGKDLLWAAEQVLRSGECGAVVLWGQAAGRALNHRALQRLHLAAGTGKALCFLYRPLNAQMEASPAPLRLRLSAESNVLHVHIVKCRGAARALPIPVRIFPEHWHSRSLRHAPSCHSRDSSVLYNQEAASQQVHEFASPRFRDSSLRHSQDFSLRYSSFRHSRENGNLHAQSELRDSRFRGNDEVEICGNDESEIYGNDAAEIYGNDEVAIRGNDEAEIYGNDEVAIRGNDEAEIYGNDEVAICVRSIPTQTS